MAEKNENVNVDKESTANNSSVELAEEKTYENYRKETNMAHEDLANANIKSEIEKISKDIAKRKWEKFKEKHPELKANSATELEGDLVAEYEEFQLEQADVQDIFTQAKQQITKITDNRQEKLNKLAGNKAAGTIGEIEKLEKNVSDKLGEIEKDINNLKNSELTDENKKKLEDLESQKEKLLKIKENIGEKEGAKQKGTLYGDISIAISNQNLVKENAFNQLADAFSKDVKDGKNLVLNDSELKKALVTAKKVAEKANDEIEKSGEEQEKENKEAKAGQKSETKMPGNLQDILKAAGAGAAAAAATSPKKDIVLGEDISFADVLGYAPYNGVNFKTSMDVLDVFLGKKESPAGIPMTDGVRIALLASPEGAHILQTTLMRLNTEPGKFDFIKKFKAFNMNNQIKKMINKQLPATLKANADEVSKEDKEKIAKDLAFEGIDLNGDIQAQLKNMEPEEINSLQAKIDGLNANYKEKITELNKLLSDNSLSEESRKIYENQLNMYTEKRKALGSSIANYVGVHKFTEISKDAMLGKKSEVYMLNPKSKIDDAPENDLNNIRNQTQGLEDISNEELEKISNNKEKEDKAKENQNIENKSIGE